MRSRLFFFGVTTFWLVMNFLLFRSQWGAHNGFGNSVPVTSVWDKILTAPDNSALEIYDRQERIGFGRWEAGTADSPLISSKILAQDYRPGQTAPALTGYGLSFDGSVQFFVTNHVRFQISLALDTNKVWQEFSLRATMRPQSWEIHAVAALQTVQIKVNDDSGAWEKTMKFSDLQDPQTLLGDFADPMILGLLGLNHNLLGGAGAAIQWEAREDRMQFGQANLRVYRLDSLFLGQRVEVIVSRIGEILRLDLPFDISLRNQALLPAGI
ncbi:MAG: hypothetical protein ABSA47_06405 [Verrucomicrobiota bacterium]|jgi:hypothetical protein